jgi:vacuolar-type H+-ATPase subunit C/Vma6
LTGYWTVSPSGFINQTTLRLLTQARQIESVIEAIVAYFKVLFQYSPEWTKNKKYNYSAHNLALDQESNLAPPEYKCDQRPDAERAVTDNVT